MESAENILTEEVAQDNLQLFLDYYDIDENDIDDKVQKNVFKSASKKLVKAIRRGDLTIESVDGEIKVSQKLSESETILVYAILSGKHKVVMDDENNDNNYKRMYQLVSSLTSVPYAKITRLCRKDLAVLENLAMLFLFA